MPSTNASLPHGLAIDRLFYIDLADWIGLAYGAFAVLVLHPIITWLIARHSSFLTTSSWIEQLVIQINTALFDVMAALLYRPYPLVPIPGMVCLGWLCSAGISGKLLMTIQGLLSINLCESWIITMFHNLQLLIARDSKWRMSYRTLIISMVIIYLAMLIVVFGVYRYGDNMDHVEYELALPYLSWTTSYPSVQLFGRYGESNEFSKAMLLLGATMVVVYIPLPLIIRLMRRDISRAMVKSSLRTRELRSRGVRVTRVRLIHLSATLLLPYAILLLGMIGVFDRFPAILLPHARCGLVVLFYTQSCWSVLIFWIFYPGYSEVLRRKMGFGGRKDSVDIAMVGPMQFWNITPRRSS